MRLTLNNHEIESAIRAYVEHQGVSTDNKQVDVILNAKRGDGKGGKGSMEAIVDIFDCPPNYATSLATPGEQMDIAESEAKSLFNKSSEEEVA